MSLYSSGQTFNKQVDQKENRFCSHCDENQGVTLQKSAAVLKSRQEKVLGAGKQDAGKETQTKAR